MHELRRDLTFWLQILKDDITRGQYDYAIAHPEEVYWIGLAICTHGKVIIWHYSLEAFLIHVNSSGYLVQLIVNYQHV